MEEKRTTQQNRSLHKYCTDVARELNNAGVPVSVFMEDIEADYTMDTVKMLWKAFARAKYGKTSTTELTKKQIDEIYDEVNRHVARFGIHVEFPSRDLLDYQRIYDER